MKQWLEKGLHPKQAIKAQFSVWISSISLSLAWVYQGLIPKLLYPATGEIEILVHSGLFGGEGTNGLEFIRVR
ncbi:hypothetical protein HOH45_04135 [bacterium]|nr:hypothetical protein [bacterium]